MQFLIPELGVLFFLVTNQQILIILMLIILNKVIYAKNRYWFLLKVQTAGPLIQNYIKSKSARLKKGCKTNRISWSHHSQVSGLGSLVFEQKIILFPSGLNTGETSSCSSEVIIPGANISALNQEVPDHGKDLSIWENHFVHLSCLMKRT